jgi:hypothetical protein
MPAQHTLYLVLERTSPSRWYRKANIVAMTKKEPTLNANQKAVKILVEIPDNIWEPPTVALTLDHTNIIQPKPEVKQV